MFNDADCGFCMRTAAHVHRLGVDVEARTLQEADLTELGIDADRAHVEVAAIDADGAIHYGHEAWAAILRTGAWPWRALGNCRTGGPCRTRCAHCHDTRVGHLRRPRRAGS